MSTKPSQNAHSNSQALPDPEAKLAPEQGLIREFWALLLVYGTLIILPLLTGIACES